MAEKIERGSTGLALKAGFWYVVSNVLVKGIAFLTTPIFSRLMSEADYGEFTNFALWQSVLFQITGAELYSTLNRAYYDHEKEYDSYVTSITVLGAIITAAFYLLFLLGGDWIYRIVAIPPQFVHLLFFYLLVLMCKQTYIAREKTLYQYKSVAGLTMIQLSIPTLIAVVLVIFAEDTQRLSARIYGYYLPAALIGLYCMGNIAFRSRTVRLSHWRYALRLSLPLMVHNLTAYLLTSTNTIVTKNVLGAEETAKIAICTSVIHVLTILLQAVSGAMTTWLMDNLEQKKEKAARKGVILYAGGICVLALGLILFGPELVWILGGEKYAAVNSILPGMIAATAIQSIATIYTIILTYQKRVTATAAITTLVAVVSIAAKVVLLPEMGLGVLPWINIVAFGLILISSCWLVCRGGHRSVVSVTAMAALSAALILFVLVSQWLYAHILVRYAIILLCAGVFFGVLYRYREMVRKLVQKKFGKKQK